MAELSALLDQLTLLVRHLIVAVKQAPANYDRLAFNGAIQALGSTLDSIDANSQTPEAQQTIRCTRAFAHTMITLVAAKQGKGDVDVDMALQAFLSSAKLYQDAITAFRSVVEDELEAMDGVRIPQQPPPTPASTPVDTDSAIPDFPFGRRHSDSELDELESNLNDLASMSLPDRVKTKKSAVMVQMPKRGARADESQNVTDKLFDYLGEILDHNVLGDEDELPEMEMVDVELDDL